MLRLSGVKSAVRARAAAGAAFSVSLSGPQAVSLLALPLVRHATKRAGGGKTNLKDSIGRRLGVKATEGTYVQPSDIIYRQRGTKFYPGENTWIGRDHTIYAKEPGYVRFYYDPFHPTRRFVGVGLTPEARLPTDHMAPRARRFGRNVISDPKRAEAELAWRPNKEQQLLEEISERRAVKQAEEQALTDKLAAKLKELGFDNSELAARAQKMAHYRTLGWTNAEAARFADAFLNTSSDVKDFDAKFEVTKFGTVVPKSSPETVEKELNETRDKLTKVRQPNAFISLSQIAKIDKILDATVYLSQSQKEQLADEFKATAPLLEAVQPHEEVVKAAKKGKGKLVKVYNVQRKGIDYVLAPKDAHFSEDIAFQKEFVH
ncbi:YALIA101S12e01838g1_1 [Yarrowia lipolytica]|nr:54S ribosomal protein L2 [Yarrowia lipolytica]SEI36527.1 YALIA101S12e01838g1_1 [Yarrowia lipolytica]